MTPREHRRQRVRALAGAGPSARSIAQEVGANRATVGRDLAHLGLKPSAAAGDSKQCRPAVTGPSTTPCGRTSSTCNAESSMPDTRSESTSSSSRCLSD